MLCVFSLYVKDTYMSFMWLGLWIGTASTGTWDHLWKISIFHLCLETLPKQELPKAILKPNTSMLPAFKDAAARLHVFPTVSQSECERARLVSTACPLSLSPAVSVVLWSYWQLWQLHKDAPIITTVKRVHFAQNSNFGDSLIDRPTQPLDTLLRRDFFSFASLVKQFLVHWSLNYGLL